MAQERQSIRVNLRFGARTDPALIQELMRLAPRDRAQWVRAWVIDGWRQRSERTRESENRRLNTANSTAAASMPLGKTTGAKPATAHIDTGKPDTSDSVFALFGTRIR
jgi:hypothetical protein